MITQDQRIYLDHQASTPVDERRAHSSIYISVGRADEEQINTATDRIIKAAKQLRAFAL